MNANLARFLHLRGQLNGFNAATGWEDLSDLTTRQRALYVELVGAYNDALASLTSEEFEEYENIREKLTA